MAVINKLDIQVNNISVRGSDADPQVFVEYQVNTDDVPIVRETLDLTPVMSATHRSQLGVMMRAILSRLATVEGM